MRETSPSGARSIETLLFGHRVFSNTGDRELPDQLVAIRARRLYPAVVMAVEQAGITNSRIYARLARHAELVGRVDDPARAIMASTTVSGSARAHDRHHPSAERDVGGWTTTLLESLAATPFEDGRYHGGVATWLARAWVPAVRPVGPSPGRAGTIEQAAATALAGRATASDPADLVGRASLRRRLRRHDETPARCGPRARRWTDARRRAGARTHRVGPAAKRDRPGARGPVRTRSCAARSTARSTPSRRRSSARTPSTCATRLTRLCATSRRSRRLAICRGRPRSVGGSQSCWIF